MHYHQHLLVIVFLVQTLVGLWDRGVGPLVHATDDDDVTQDREQKQEKVVEVNKRDIVMQNARRTKEAIDGIESTLSTIMEKLKNIETALVKQDEVNSEQDSKLKLLERAAVNTGRRIDFEEVKHPDGFLTEEIPPLKNYRCKWEGDVLLNVSGEIMKFYCDLKATPGFIIQRRFDGSIDFNRGWDEYARGFGNMRGEFWLGLERIRAIVASGRYKLRVDMSDKDKNVRWAEYDYFIINDASDNYRLTNLGSYSGTAGNSLGHIGEGGQHLNNQFSTPDRDNDRHSNCASSFKSGWWYDNCFWCNLNKPWSESGIILDWSDFSYSIVKSQMKLIPYN